MILCLHMLSKEVWLSAFMHFYKISCVKGNNIDKIMLCCKFKSLVLKVKLF
jgi:hypothetical protein